MAQDQDLRTLSEAECQSVGGARPGRVTTLAIGEEDGGGSIYTTLAVGEEEGGFPRFPVLDAKLHR